MRSVCGFAVGNLWLSVCVYAQSALADFRVWVSWLVGPHDFRSFSSAFTQPILINFNLFGFGFSTKYTGITRSYNKLGELL